MRTQLVISVLASILVPLALWSLSAIDVLPLPLGVGSQTFFPIAVFLCLFSLPVFVLLAARSITSPSAYVAAGALPPFPIAFFVTQLFGAIVDDTELNLRLNLLWVVAGTGALSGIAVGAFAKRLVPNYSVKRTATE